MLSQGNVLLRQLQRNDASTLAELINNKKIWDNLRDYIPYPYAKSDGQSFIEATLTQSPVTTFAIVFQNAFCGVIGLNPQKDIYRKSAEVGYWIGEPFWNKGIATISLQLITNYGFSTLKLERIFASTFSHNTASKAVIEKCGYKLEGIARNAVIKNDRILDEHRYAILKSDHFI